MTLEGMKTEEKRGQLKKNRVAKNKSEKITTNCKRRK